MADEDDKRINDTIAREYLEHLDPERRNKHIANSVMRLKLSNWYDKSLRKDELYIISNPEFKKSIAEARKQLNLKSESDELDDSLSYDLEIEVENIVKKMGLSEEWKEYVSSYITDGKPPKHQVFYGNKYIKITRIDEEGRLSLELEPGLRREDYVNAWRAIASYLGPAQKKSKPYTSQELNNQIYEARQMLTYGALAMMFFPRMDKGKAIDRVKKAVKREGQRRKRGGGQN